MTPWCQGRTGVSRSDRFGGAKSRTGMFSSMAERKRQRRCPASGANHFNKSTGVTNLIDFTITFKF